MLLNWYQIDKSIIICILSRSHMYNYSWPYVSLCKSHFYFWAYVYMCPFYFLFVLKTVNVCWQFVIASPLKKCGCFRGVLFLIKKLWINIKPTNCSIFCCKCDDKQGYICTDRIKRAKLTLIWEYSMYISFHSPNLCRKVKLLFKKSNFTPFGE